MICNKCNHKLPDDSEFCQYCGSKVDTQHFTVDVARAKQELKKPETSKSSIKAASNKIPVQKINKDIKLFRIVNIITIVLTLISILCILIAMNVQDARRNLYEYPNATIVYLLMLVLTCSFLIMTIIAGYIKNMNIQTFAFLGTAIALFIVLATSVGSICSYGFFDESNDYVYYINGDIVDALNFICWVTFGLIFIIDFILIVNDVVNRIVLKWRSSIKYRENSFKRVARVHSYYSAGIITKEEFEKVKKDILKYIED